MLDTQQSPTRSKFSQIPYIPYGKTGDGLDCYDLARFVFAYFGRELTVPRCAGTIPEMLAVAAQCQAITEPEHLALLLIPSGFDGQAALCTVYREGEKYWVVRPTVGGSKVTPWDAVIKNTTVLALIRCQGY